MEWVSAEAVLVGEMRALIKILEATLDDDDPRWLAFGLQMPATKATPGQPQNVTATMDDSGAIVVACDPVPLVLALPGARATEPKRTVSAEAPPSSPPAPGNGHGHGHPRVSRVA